MQPLRYARSFALRQAVLHIARPGNQTRVILLAVGLGAFFILGVRRLQANLLRDFAIQAGPNAPDMFLIDIQPDQRDGARRLPRCRERRRSRPRRSFRCCAPAWSASAARTWISTATRQSRGRGLAREYTVTYRPQLEANERDDRRQWWGDAPFEGEPEVSIEERFSDPDDDGNFRLGSRIQVGDEMRFDVLGRVITARVASVRRVNWQDFRAGGFMFVFRPGTFDGAPHTYISALQRAARRRAPARRCRRARRASFRTSRSIDLREILQTVQAIVEQRHTGGDGRRRAGARERRADPGRRRVDDEVPARLRSGDSEDARREQPADRRRCCVLEYGVLGAIAGTVGALGAIALSWAVARYALELPWEPAPGSRSSASSPRRCSSRRSASLASLDVLRHKPLATLRAE